MSLEAFWDWLQNTDLALEIGATWWFPLIESIHVVAIAMVLGSILMVDLRLLGFSAGVYRMSRFQRELTRWTWSGFVVAVFTGLGMFITRPAAYAANPAFQVKLLLLALAGINVAAIHAGAMRSIAKWEGAKVTPISVRIAAAASLFLWAGVALAGRWTGHLQ
jgi:hypothetical protein|tara:strand:+ start:776 stop:1264 length:489 start_codon:yes stop_codon:yes gene_type:complete